MFRVNNRRNIIEIKNCSANPMQACLKILAILHHPIDKISNILCGIRTGNSIKTTVFLEIDI